MIKNEENNDQVISCFSSHSILLKRETSCLSQGKENPAKEDFIDYERG
jgi:hypothetical protein